jgi:hypothetical protein
MNALFRRAAAEGGYEGRIETHRTELASLKALVARSHRGDVAAVMSHVERAQLFAWLAREGFRPVTLPRLRALLAARAASP